MITREMHLSSLKNRKPQKTQSCCFYVFPSFGTSSIPFLVIWNKTLRFRHDGINVNNSEYSDVSGITRFVHSERRVITWKRTSFGLLKTGDLAA